MRGDHEKAAPSPSSCGGKGQGETWLQPLNLYMSSHALLLRLFLSPGFFSVLRALQYIRNYSDNVGITHWLTRKLSNDVPIEELADKWMLVWYSKQNNHFCL